MRQTLSLDTMAALPVVVPTPPNIQELERLGDEIAELAAHLDAATARLLALIREFDEEAYRPASLARGESASYLLDTIVAEHDQLARLLEGLPDGEWARQGQHPSMGVLSIELLARRISEHAVEHAAQITEAAR